APGQHGVRRRKRLEGIPEPQRHEERHRGAHVLGRRVERGEARTRADHQRDARQRVQRPAHWIRPASTSHTGVSWPGRKGSAPRSVWLSSGLWKSLPREAARPNSLAASAYTTSSAAVWLPVTTSRPAPP